MKGCAQAEGREVQYMYSTNKGQLGRNYDVLRSFGTPIGTCFATHTGAASPAEEKGTAGNLSSALLLAVSAAVMFTYILWTDLPWRIWRIVLRTKRPKPRHFPMADDIVFDIVSD